LRDPFKRVVQRIDAQLHPAPIVLAGDHHSVVQIEQERIINLQQQAGVHHHAVLFLQRLGECEEIVLL
jgi:hypothetical protein